MTPAAFKGFLMAELENQPVPSVLHALMWACMFGAVDAFIAGRIVTGIISFILGIVCQLCSSKWEWTKAHLGSSVLPLERIASKRSYRWIAGSILLIILLLGLVLSIYSRYSRTHGQVTTETTKPGVSSPVAVPVSFRLGGEWDHIPIHIPVASDIHVLRIWPGTLIPTNSQNVFLDRGSFETISANEDKPLDWPTKKDGRWMTKRELESWLKSGRGIPNPAAFKCTMSSYTSETLDEIVAVLLVDTPDKKRHSYWVPFDPIMSGKSYTFYVIFPCSSGVIPELVQWGDTAIVRVLGEGMIRKVPLRYEKQPWPSQLLSPALGPSIFIWNGIGECKWD